MSVPPVSSSSQVTVGHRLPCRRPRPWCLILLLAPLTPLLFLLCQPLRQRLWPDHSIWGLASPSGRAEGSSVIPVDWNYTKDLGYYPDSGYDEVVIPCRSPTADPKPHLRLVDPAAVILPVYCTPVDDAYGVQVSLGTQYISPVFGKLPYPSGHKFTN